MAGNSMISDHVCITTDFEFTLVFSKWVLEVLRDYSGLKVIGRRPDDARSCGDREISRDYRHNYCNGRLFHNFSKKIDILY